MRLWADELVSSLRNMRSRVVSSLVKIILDGVDGEREYRLVQLPCRYRLDNRTTSGQHRSTQLQDGVHPKL